MNGTYVYMISSTQFPEKRYVGLTRTPEARLKDHNEGLVERTWRYRPWELMVLVWFKQMNRAEAFERYLKHGSGHAFAKRHFW